MVFYCGFNLHFIIVERKTFISELHVFSHGLELVFLLNGVFLKRKVTDFPEVKFKRFFNGSWLWSNTRKFYPSSKSGIFSCFSYCLLLFLLDSL